MMQDASATEFLERRAFGRRARNTLRRAAAGVAIIGLSFAFVRLAPEWPRLWLFDLYQRLAPVTRDPARIVIIDIDETSVRRDGPWPWPRRSLARLIDATEGARAVGVDILLLDPDRSAGGDEVLEEALRRAPTVLAAARAALPQAGDAPSISVPLVLQRGAATAPWLPSLSPLAWPITDLADAAQGVGLAVVPAGWDGIGRRLPSLYDVDGTLVPAFAVEVLRVASGADRLEVRANGLGITELAIGSTPVPTDPHGAIWPRFARTAPAQIVSASDVMSGSVTPAQFRDRIVLIGSSLSGLGDVHLTPLRVSETGTAINAQVIASMLAGDALFRPGGAEDGEASVLAAFAGLGFAVWRRLSPLAFFALLAGTVGLLAGVSAALYADSGLLLDWIVPAAGLSVFAAGFAVARVRRMRRAQRQTEVELVAALSEVDAARGVVTQALAAAKLATLGELATMLAHELRQPIATMSLAAENAEASLHDGAVDVADVRRRIGRILQQARRAESIVQHLSVFGRADPGDDALVELGEVVAAGLLLVGPTLRRHGVRIEVEGAPEPCLTHAPSVLLEQVVINLLLNAKDALAAWAQPRIVRLRLGVAVGLRALVRLEVVDNGPGLPGAIAERVFEPFFTTKPAGEGTGLGLSICRKIVESLGGRIMARNGEKGGAVFTVELPAASISPET